MAKGLYKFYWDCGRMGDVQGVFIAESERVASVIGSSIYFGEILGKHSEVYGTLEEKDLTLVTEDPAVLEALGDFSAGHNPLDYVEGEGE